MLATLSLLLLMAQPAAVDTPPVTPAPTPGFATVTFKADASSRRFGGPGPYFPEKADRMRRDGSTTLDCAAGPFGALDDCRLLSEAPSDFGFGAASLFMAKRRWMTLAAPFDAQPKTPEGRVRVRVDFKRK